VTGDRPDLSSERAPYRENPATFRQKKWATFTYIVKETRKSQGDRKIGRGFQMGA
jgi:hypothetical protein